MNDDIDLWKAAQTLSDLGELTARWLEGTINAIPTYLADGPDEETTLLIPVLAAANRAGFITDQSQPGEPRDEHGCAQRASVSGFAGPGAFARLMAAASTADLIITAARALDDNPVRQHGPFHAITLDQGEEFTWDGGANSRSILLDGYREYLHPAALEAISNAWQVTLIDPVWGRNDVLWPVLEAFATPSNPGNPG